MISQKRLKELLHYDPESGVFVWKVTRSINGLANAGSIAGSVVESGYIHIMVDGKQYKAHRLAWLYVHGEFPPKHIDHANGNPSDNRLVNLRPASHSENACNQGKKSTNTSGWCGVSFHKQSGKHRAEIMLAGNCHYLGGYDSPEIAAAVYNHVCQQVHGEFARPDIPDWMIVDSNTIKAIGGNMKQISKALAAAAIHNAKQQEKQPCPK